MLRSVGQFFYDFLIGIIKNNRGSISIEMAVVMLCFFSIIFFAVDIGMYFSNKSKIERVNYSLSSIFRERSSLYSGEMLFDEAEVTELAEVAKIQLGKVATGVLIKVELLQFSEANSTENNAQIDYVNSRFGNEGITKSLDDVNKAVTAAQHDECFGDLTPLDSLSDMSVWTSYHRWSSLYRISLCVPNMMLSAKLMATVKTLPDKIIVSNTVLAR